MKRQDKTHKEIKESQEKIRDLTEMLPEMVFEVDKHCKFTFINKKGLQMLGYSREELINKKNFCQFLSHSEQKKVNPGIKEFFQEEKNYPHEYYLIRKDKVIIPVEIHGSVIKDNAGKEIGFCGILFNT